MREKLRYNLDVARRELTKCYDGQLKQTKLSLFLRGMMENLIRISQSMEVAYDSMLAAKIYSPDIIEMGLRKSLEIAIFCNWLVDQGDDEIVDRVLAHQSQKFEESWEIPDPHKVPVIHGKHKGLPRLVDMSKSTIKGAWLSYKRLSWLHHAPTMQGYAQLESERHAGGMSPEELYTRRCSDSLNSQADVLEYAMAYVACEIAKNNMDKIEFTPSQFR